MLRLFRLLFVAVAVIPMTPLHLAAQAVSISLNRAIDLALDGNPDIAIARHNMSSAEFAARESRGNFLPKLNLVGSYTRNIDKPVIFLPEGFGGGGAVEIGANNNFNAYLDLTVPLYSKNNLSARNYAEQYYYAQRESLKTVQQSVKAKVKKAYLALLLCIETVAVREKALENAEQIYVSIVHKVRQGVATEYDVTSARVRASNLRNDLLEARSQIVPAEDELALLIGLPSETLLTLTDSLFLTDEELTFVPVAAELANNSTLRQKELQVEVAKRQTDMVRSGYFPTISGIGSYQYQSQQNDFRLSSYDWVLSSALGVRLQVPVFNGMITRNRTQQFMLNERVARTQRDYTSRVNDAQFAQLVSRLIYLKKRMEAQTDNISLAAKAIELVRERFHYGKASLLEVNSAELDYVTAKLGYLHSVVDYKATFCDLELLTGK